jgi:hypothetical protein
MPFRLLRLLVVLGCSLVPCLAQKAADKSANPPGFDEAIARYRTCKARLAFVHHTEGRQRLAETRTETAFALLADDYVTSRTFPEYTRYTIATLFARNFDNKDFVDQLTQLRVTNQKPVDTWLWINALRIEADRVGDADSLAIARDGKSVLQRAAAIAAVGLSRGGNIKSVIVPTCATFPKKESERMALLGAMSGALWDNKSRVNTAEYRDALTAYIGLLGDDVALTHTAKLQVARHLQWILKGPGLWMNPEPWLELMQRGDVKTSNNGQTVVAQRFFGVESSGERVCFVVDMSDSMCIEISPDSKPKRTGPVTGQQAPKKKRELLDENDLPWDRIKSRWDLAREQLRISLLRMPAEKFYSIVWFGTESGALESCRGMTKATRMNVDRTLAELDSIKQGKPEPGIAPDGRLRGRTNMHSGLRRAFGLAGRGFVEANAYVDPEALTEGCDTIFLLSDGAPSWDDFAQIDKDYGEGKVVLDTEYGVAAARTPRLEYHGPYDQEDWLIEDVRRMNVFRRIQMHCVGLGEANVALLRKLADVGHGEVFVFGAKK